MVPVAITIVPVTTGWFADLIASSHAIGECSSILVAFFLSPAGATVVLEVVGDTMGPAVRDGLSVVVGSLRSWRWITITVPVSVPVAVAASSRVLGVHEFL